MRHMQNSSCINVPNCYVLQVLSESVAIGLRTYFKDEAEETANFVQMFDQFFDCLNVTNYTKHYTKRKPFLAPYRWGNDNRITVNF